MANQRTKSRSMHCLWRSLSSWMVTSSIASPKAPSKTIKRRAEPKVAHKAARTLLIA